MSFPCRLSHYNILRLCVNLILCARRLQFKLVLPHDVFLASTLNPKYSWVYVQMHQITCCVQFTKVWADLMPGRLVAACQLDSNNHVVHASPQPGSILGLVVCTLSHDACTVSLEGVVHVK